MTTTGSTFGIRSRLLGAMALVAAAGAATAWAVAAVVGPAIFHDHMLMAGLDENAPATVHAEAAFRSASATALALALGTAAVASLTVSHLLTRRIGRSLRTLSAAASQVAAGEFGSRVPAPRIGAEFDDLAVSFNDMAERLDESHALQRRLHADVAHELRTPVATLSAYLEGLEDGVEELSPRTIAILRSQGARLARLADDLAAVTRAESRDLPLDLVPSSPADLLSLAEQVAHDRADRRAVTLLIDAAADLPEVAVDRDRLDQVLGNLVDNALRHTPGGGTVTLRARLCATDDDSVELSVQDTGEGIGSEHLPHVFERFYRADTARDREHGGSGIGLAIAKALVEAHGGTIGATSPGPGAGTTVTLTLPAA